MSLGMEEVFLRDVPAAPDDDVPRRVYADWLMDQTDPHLSARGDFVHLQCERAARPPDDPEAPELLAEEYRLLAAHRDAWDAPLTALTERCEYRRGFAEGV